jgi:hypothetical protein
MVEDLHSRQIKTERILKDSTLLGVDVAIHCQNSNTRIAVISRLGGGRVIIRDVHCRTLPDLMRMVERLPDDYTPKNVVWDGQPDIRSFFIDKTRPC